jgi:hypothetical protein
MYAYKNILRLCLHVYTLYAQVYAYIYICIHIHIYIYKMHMRVHFTILIFC